MWSKSACRDIKSSIFFDHLSYLSRDQWCIRAGKHVRNTVKRKRKERKKEKAVAFSNYVWNNDRIGSQTTFDLDLSASGSTADANPRSISTFVRMRGWNDGRPCLFFFLPLNQRTNQPVSTTLLTSNRNWRCGPSSRPSYSYHCCSSRGKTARRPTGGEFVQHDCLCPLYR